MLKFKLKMNLVKHYLWIKESKKCLLSPIEGAHDVSVCGVLKTAGQSPVKDIFISE